jgi:hypothetical protein
MSQHFDDTGIEMNDSQNTQSSEQISNGIEINDSLEATLFSKTMTSLTSETI